MVRRRIPGAPDAPRSAARGYTRGPHIFRRGKRWWAYLPDRDPARVSLQTDDERTARRELGRLLHGGAVGSIDPRPTEALLSEIAAAYLEAPHGWTRRTMYSCEQRALAFVRVMERRGVRLPSQITAEILDQWINDRGTEVARSTLNRDLDVARKMLRWASHDDRRLCGDTPILRRGKLREPKRRQRKVIPSPTDVLAVAVAMETAGELGAALTLRAALATGHRIEELRRLRPENVTDHGVTIMPEAGPAATAWESKGYEDNTIALTSDAVEIVRAFLAWRTTAKGGKGKRVGISDTWIATRIDAARATVDVAKFRMHDVRRVFATEAVNAGIKIAVVSKWLSHKDIATTERYVGTYRNDGSIKAPTVAGRLPSGEMYKLYKPGADSSILQHTRSVPAEKNPAGNPASPGRVELPTNGLGNHGADTETLVKPGVFVRGCAKSPSAPCVPALESFAALDLPELYYRCLVIEHGGEGLPS